MKPGPHTAEFFAQEIGRLERHNDQLKRRLRRYGDWADAVDGALTDMAERLDDFRYLFDKEDQGRKVATDIAIRFNEIVQSWRSIVKNRPDRVLTLQAETSTVSSSSEPAKEKPEEPGK